MLATMEGTRVLGGIMVIDTPLVTRAFDYARTHSVPYLFNHAARSWLFAVRLGQLQGVAHDEEVVAVSALLHDLGLTSSFTGPKRFEAASGASPTRCVASSRRSRRPPTTILHATSASVSWPAARGRRQRWTFC